MEDINNYIYEKLKKSQRGASRRPRLDLKMKNVEFDEINAKYYEIRKFILRKMDFMKITLVLGLKKITWKKELEKKFDVFGKEVEEYFDYMKENDMILFKPLVEVDDLLFETVIKQNSNSFYGCRDQVKVYTLSPFGNEVFIKLLDHIIELSKKRTSLSLEIDNILSKTEAHRSIMKRIYLEETNKNERTIQYPDGFVEVRKTLRYKKFKEELAEAMTEAKKEHLENKQESKELTLSEQKQLITLNEGKALTVIEEDKQKNKSGITYNGVYSHLTKKEIEDLMKGVTKEEEEEANREEKQEKKRKRELLKEANKEAMDDPYTKAVMSGIGKSLEQLEKEKNNNIFDVLGIEE